MLLLCIRVLVFLLENVQPAPFRFLLLAKIVVPVTSTSGPRTHEVIGELALGALAVDTFGRSGYLGEIRGLVHYGCLQPGWEWTAMLHRHGVLMRGEAGHGGVAVPDSERCLQLLLLMGHGQAAGTQFDFRTSF